MILRAVITGISHCVKSFRIPILWSAYSRVSLRIQSEGGKIWTRQTPNTDTFYAVSIKVATDRSEFCTSIMLWAM